jgi:hypothetical protein
MHFQPAGTPAGFYHGFGFAPVVCPFWTAVGGFLAAAPAFLLAGERPSCRSRRAVSSFSALTCSSSVIGADDRAGGMSCTAGYSRGFSGRAGAPAGSPRSPGRRSMIGPAEQPPSAATRLKPATRRIRSNPRFMCTARCAADPETDVDSMDYIRALLAG